MIAASNRFAHGRRHLRKTLASSAAVALLLSVGVGLISRNDSSHENTDNRLVL